MRRIFFAALIVLGDQWVKAVVEHFVPMGGNVPLIPGVMSITRLHNSGAAFGMLRGMRVPLLVLTVAVCIALIIYLLTDSVKPGIYCTSLTMILGGAMGNAVDRVMDGYVVDMFKTLFVDFAVFNVADCFVTVGGIMLCAYVLADTLKDRKKTVTEVENAEADGR